MLLLICAFLFILFIFIVFAFSHEKEPVSDIERHYTSCQQNTSLMEKGNYQSIPGSCSTDTIDCQLQKDSAENTIEMIHCESYTDKLVQDSNPFSIISTSCSQSFSDSCQLNHRTADRDLYLLKRRFSLPSIFLPFPSDSKEFPYRAPKLSIINLQTGNDELTLELNNPFIPNVLESLDRTKNYVNFHFEYCVPTMLHCQSECIDCSSANGGVSKKRSFHDVECDAELSKKSTSCRNSMQRPTFRNPALIQSFFESKLSIDNPFL